MRHQGKPSKRELLNNIKKNCFLKKSIPTTVPACFRGATVDKWCLQLLFFLNGSLSPSTAFTSLFSLLITHVIEKNIDIFFGFFNKLFYSTVLAKPQTSLRKNDWPVGKSLWLGRPLRPHKGITLQDCWRIYLANMKHSAESPSLTLTLSLDSQHHGITAAMPLSSTAAPVWAHELSIPVLCPAAWCDETHPSTLRQPLNKKGLTRMQVLRKLLERHWHNVKWILKWHNIPNLAK